MPEIGAFMEVKEKLKENKGGAEQSLRAQSVGGSVSTMKLLTNISAAVLGFLFGGCHLAFGAYPLGIGLVAVLPGCIWSALCGVVLGSLTAGRNGIIYGMVSVLTVFLRIIISGGGIKSEEEKEGKKVFCESLTLRLASAVIAGAVSALYEILLSGISPESLLFGSVMILAPALQTVLLYGSFSEGIGLRELLFGKKPIFTRGRGMVLYRISLLSFILLSSVSLAKYDIFGVDPGFIFAGAVTLFSAKRFGPLYGSVCGFVASVGLSGLYSVSFALAGAAAGVVFAFGHAYALLAGGILLSAWGAYVGGVSGLLEVFPEYLISASLMLPAFRYFEREVSGAADESVMKRATDMVGTMALSHRSRQAFSAERISEVIYRMVPAVSRFSESEITVDDYSVFARISEEVNRNMLAEREMDEELTDKLEAVLAESGIGEGVIRAFGKRRKHIICSAEDKDGSLITSKQLRSAIENTAGVRLAVPEYFRRGEMVMMDCMADRKYRIESACSKKTSERDAVSGDSVKSFESKDMFAYGLICDGMGSGKEAKRISDFSSGFLKNALDLEMESDTLMHMLNSLLRRKGDECGVTVDLFSFDLITGNAFFLKSGAAPSYVKRRDSLFRIKSETMPLGILREVDVEKISVKAEPGDYVIMLSDGMLDDSADNTRLVELLNKPPLDDLQAYAELLVDEAGKTAPGEDDRSILVIRISEIE